MDESFFCYGRSYCTDLYSLYNSTDLVQKSRQLWAQILRQISDFCSLFLGHTKQSVQLTFGTKIEVQKKVVQQYGLGTKNEAEYSGTVLLL
jgi:hypothetical protein